MYHHSRVSANDEGISLGQTMIAAKVVANMCLAIPFQLVQIEGNNAIGEAVKGPAQDPRGLYSGASGRRLRDRPRGLRH